MFLAYDYPLLAVFWSFLIFFFWIVWIMALFYVFADIFRSHDMGGFPKFLWVLFVILLPYLGVFVYLLARGHKMGEHAAADARAMDAAQRAYIQDAAGAAPSPGDELARLAALKDEGHLTDAEFQQMKAKIVNA
jgi:hypothetical protein